MKTEVKVQKIEDSLNKPFKKPYNYERQIDKSKYLHDEADQKQPDDRSKQSEYFSEVSFPSLKQIQQENYGNVSDIPSVKYHSFRKGLENHNRTNKIGINSESNVINLLMF